MSLGRYGNFRRWAGAGLLLAPLALAHPVLAEPMVFAGQSVDIVTPSGSCTLDPGRSDDAALFKQMEQAQAGRNRVVKIFADCAELGDFRAGKRSGIVHQGMVLLPLQDGEIALAPGLTRAEFLDQFAAAFPAIDMAAVKTETQERVGGIGVKIDTGQIKSLGSLRRDESGVYLWFLIEPGQSVEQPVLTISAVTLVNSLPISIVLVRPYLGDATVEEGLDAGHEALKDLIAANAATESAAASGWHWLGIDWSGVAMSALIGALIAGAGGGVLALVQARRARRRG